MPNQNVADLLSKIERRVDELGADKINLGRFMNEADYRSGLVHTYSNSEDTELRELARQAISLNVVEQVGLQDFTTGNKLSFSSWILDRFYYLLLGTTIVLIGIAAVFFARDGAQPGIGIVERASIDPDKPIESLQPVQPTKSTEPAKPATTGSVEKTEHLPVERPKVILRMHGSNTLGASLAPALANAYLESIGASETVLVTTDKSAENYIQGYLPTTKEAVAVEVFAHGSSTAFKGLAARQADIGMSSRPITTEEREQLRPLYGDLASGNSEIVIGLDGLTIIVNEINPIESLTIPQLAALFAGELTNWSHVGGSPGRVNIYARDDDSGSYDVFKRLVLERYQNTLSAASRRYESNAELSEDVAKDPNGVGFVGLSQVLRVKPLAVEAFGIATPVFPTSVAIASEDYPLMRRLYFYAVANIENPHIEGVVDFTLSEAGQEIVKNAGFISLNDYASRDYLALTENAERLPVIFRFEFGGTELDNQGKRDLPGLINYMEKHPDKNFMLFGFSDNVGSANVNLQISEERARIVENHLIPHGLRPIVVKGFGEILPIDSNYTAVGRHKNRRVEVWVN